jgi:mannitol/fructose-specific phosphotransferase system IIA component (Ntr-type)
MFPRMRAVAVRASSAVAVNEKYIRSHPHSLPTMFKLGIGDGVAMPKARSRWPPVSLS